MSNYIDVLIPLITSAALVFLCFVLYVIFGEKFCKSPNPNEIFQLPKPNDRFSSGIEVEATIPLENISFACKSISFLDVGRR